MRENYYERSEAWATGSVFDELHLFIQDHWKTSTHLFIIRNHEEGFLSYSVVIAWAWHTLVAGRCEAFPDRRSIQPMRPNFPTDSVRERLTHLPVTTSCVLTAPRLQPDIIFIAPKILRKMFHQANSVWTYPEVICSLRESQDAGEEHNSSSQIHGGLDESVSREGLLDIRCGVSVFDGVYLNTEVVIYWVRTIQYRIGDWMESDDLLCHR